MRVETKTHFGAFLSAWLKEPSRLIEMAARQKAECPEGWSKRSRKGVVEAG